MIFVQPIYTIQDKLNRNSMEYKATKKQTEDVFDKLLNTAIERLEEKEKCKEI